METSEENSDDLVLPEETTEDKDEVDNASQNCPASEQGCGPSSSSVEEEAREGTSQGFVAEEEGEKRSFVIPPYELAKWWGLALLDKKYLENVKYAYVFGEVAALVTMDDETYLVGRNIFGSLGTGSKERFYTRDPVRVDALCGKGVTSFNFGIKKKKVSRHHDEKVVSLFALTKDGSVYAWGDNSHGALGIIGPVSSRDPVLPTKVAFSEGEEIIQLACGAEHTVALASSKNLYAWGRNKYGQTGQSDGKFHTTPQLVKFEPSINIRTLSCGRGHTAILTEEGQVYTFGDNSEGQLGCGHTASILPFSSSPRRVRFREEIVITKVVCGKQHTLALAQHGKMYSFGRNVDGQLGHGGLQATSSPSVVKFSHFVIDIGAVSLHSISVCKTDLNKTFMWGKLPELDNKPVDLPWETLMLSILDVFASYAFPPAMTDTLKRTEPVSHHDICSKLMIWSGLKYISPEILADVYVGLVCGSGFEQTAVLVLQNGDVYFSGKNVHGSLGTGEILQYDKEVPIKNQTLSGQDICGFSYGLDVEGGCMCLFALSSRGYVFSWGYNDFSELGLGHKSTEPELPTRIQGELENVKVVQLACGSDHCLAVSDHGELYAWGYNFYGQAGHQPDIEDEDCVLSPKRVQGFPRENTMIENAAAGQFHSVVLTKDGQVFAWGRNDKGQVGANAKSSFNAVPIEVKFPPPGTILKICCGKSCSFAVSSIGNLYFWGSDESIEDNKVLSAPIRVFRELGPIEEIYSAHWSSMFACKTRAGKIYVWGRVNESGEIISQNPIHVPHANSIFDVFAVFSNPPSMIRPITFKR